jgi:hypothetical protein
MSLIDLIALGLAVAVTYAMGGATVYLMSVEGNPPVGRRQAACRAILWIVHILIGWPK